MRYPKLTEECKNAIKNNLCLGCVGIAEEDWQAPQKCKGIIEPKKIIKETLGVQEGIEL